MPTQFLGSVKVGGLHRTARFMEITQHQTATGDHIGYSEHQTCKSTIEMYIPYERMHTLPSLTVPTSVGLDDFFAIRNHGVGTIDR
jgi:hypothetical protein